MKNSPFLHFVICILPFTICHLASAQTRVSKTFAKTFQIASENEFIFDAIDSVQVIQTDNAQQVRLMLFIDAFNTSPEMLKSLAESGRYLIKTQSIGSQLYVSLPYMKNNIVLNGSKLKESHYFILYAPKNTTVRRQESGVRSQVSQ